MSRLAFKGVTPLRRPDNNLRTPTIFSRGPISPFRAQPLSAEGRARSQESPGAPPTVSRDSHADIAQRRDWETQTKWDPANPCHFAKALRLMMPRGMPIICTAAPMLLWTRDCSAATPGACLGSPAAPCPPTRRLRNTHDRDDRAIVLDVVDLRPGRMHAN